MKKAMAIAVLAAFIVYLSGCANTDHPPTIQDSSGIEIAASEADVSTVPEENSAASVSESKESSADSTVAVKTETESAQAEVSMPITEPGIAAQMPAPTPIAESQPPQTVVSNDTPKPEPPKVEQPQETTPPEEPAVPDFNIQTWIDYAKNYAVSVGLRLESSAVDCWDNPITAGAYSTCLDRDIESRLNRYSRDEDITDVWIWAEARSDGSYDLYIGYA